MSFEDQEELIRRDIHAFLKQHEEKELLRFVTVGSVDDGKSTLIGRLLHDAKGVYEDQLADASTTSESGDVAIDFARITDGLQAEREQGITIDVAYRYFSTPKRKFIIADTPGHVQYTRNMATGASTADVAIILIDARLGVLQQSRRHAYIASLIGIRHLMVCVNKMDLVDYGQERFDEIQADFDSFANKLNFTDVTYIPISALMGVNIVNPSDRTPWYDGNTVIGYLEDVPIAGDRNFADFRLPVQYVLRPNLDYRGFAGQISSGIIRKGDPIQVLPSGKTSRVKAIDTYHGEIDEAFAPMSITLRLEDEIDITRGDMLVRPDNLPQTTRSFDADVVWMSETPLDPTRSYLIKQTTRYVRADVRDVTCKLDLETLSEESADRLELNDIGRLRLTTHRPIIFDPYQVNRGTGAFIIIDTMTNNTVGAGMIIGAATLGDDQDDQLSGLSAVRPRERGGLLHQRPVALCISGGSEARQLSLARAIERQLVDQRHLALLTVPGEGRGAYADALATPETRNIALSALLDAGVITISCATDIDDNLRAALGEKRILSIGLRNADEDVTSADIDLVGDEHDDEHLARTVVRALTEREILYNID